MKKEFVMGFVFVLISFSLVSANVCFGVPTSCNEYSSSVSCTGQGGCTWEDEGGGSCYGSATMCNAYNDGSGCADQEECNWVSSVYCEDDQTIMRLFSGANSHAATWDNTTTTYDYEVCHDQIFGFEYVLDDPHTCVGTGNERNKLLFLSAITNAHVSETVSVEYAEEVCYGNLKCQYVGGSNDCAADEKIVARISGTSNAHISDASDTNYDEKICCKSVAVYWADTNGNRITDADVGDTVRLMAKGISGVTTFLVEEEDEVFDDDIIEISAVSDDDGVSSLGTWRIGFDDLENTNDYDQFFFEVNGERSNDLAIERTGSDDPVEVDILSPVCGSYYDVGTLMSISIFSSDPDDLINGTVSINGEVLETFTESISFNYSLEVSGEIQVVVEFENFRDPIKRGKTVSNIMVLNKTGSGPNDYVNSDYVAACISSPKDFSELGSVVEFNASTTRAIRITEGTFSEEINLFIPGEDHFIWDWLFNSGSSGETEKYVNDSDPSTYVNDFDGYIFGVRFPSSGDSSAVLRVEI